jgi:hypothetical protein
VRGALDVQEGGLRGARRGHLAALVPGIK